MPRRKGNVDAKINQQIRQLAKRLEGHKCSLSSNPGTFVERPWNSWTYERSGTVNTEFLVNSTTILDVLNQVSAKNSVPVEKLRIKVQSCGVWAIVSATLLALDLEVTFYELAGSGTVAQYPRSVQRDKGTLNLPAKCGYVYPMRDTKDIFGMDSGTRKIVDTASLAQTVVTVRIHVLWQSSA